MFNITTSALEQLADALDRIDDPRRENACFRIVPHRSGKLTLTVDAPSPDDTEYEHDGTTVLVLSEEIRERCDGRTLDADGSGSLVLA